MPPQEPPQGSDHEREKIERLRRVMYSRSLSPNIKDRERRELEEEESPVGDDWVRPEPQIAGFTVAPRTIGLVRATVRWVSVGALAFFVGAVVFFGYYFLFGGGSSPVSPGNIDISVSGPLQISSGSPAELQVAVVNRNRTALQTAELVVRYPKGTRSPTDLLTELPDQRISLNTIEPGGRRQGTVSAVFAGQEGEHGKVIVELEYRVAGSSAIFVASSEYEFLFASSPLSISVVGNTQTIGGQPIELSVTVGSNADAPVKDVLFSATYPFGFSVQSTEPAPVSGGSGNVWTLGDLNPGEKRTIRIVGVLSGESGDTRIFRFTAGTRNRPAEQTISTTLADYAHQMTVSRPFLGLAVVVTKDGSSESGAVVEPGETVSVTVQWKNNLTTAITDAVIVARLTGAEIDGKTVRTTDGFYRSSDNVVLWDKTTNAALATLTPGQAGSVSFSFQVPSGESAQSLRDPKLSITVHAAGRRVSEAGVPETLQATASETMRFASDLQLAAQGLYYASPFGSTGPMPPKAGVETRYAIVFNITNTTNKIENATIRATLPSYVRWVGSHSPASEKFVFNQNDSTVTWQIGTINPGVGIGDALPRQAAIAVGFTPSTSQIGQSPSLIRNIILTGTDASTGAPITKTTTDITTNIAGDPGFDTGDAAVVQ